MSGYPQFNIPRFDAAAARLRCRGYAVVNPAELDSPAMRAEALASPDGKLIGGTLAGETWGQVLARDVRIVADEVDAIAFLPDWEYSRGARLEAFVGLLCNKTFWYYVEGDDALHRVSAETVRSILRVCMP